MRVETTVQGTDRVKDRLARFPVNLRIERLKQMERASIYLMNYIQRNKLSGQVLKRRSAFLANHMNYDVREQGKDVIGRAGNKTVYAAIHETGGTIRPKNGMYLTIPLAAAMTPAGVVRKPARQWENTFVRTSRGGGKVMYSRDGKQAIPIFALVKSVTIPKRPYFGPATRETRSTIIGMIGQAVKTSVRIANGK